MIDASEEDGGLAAMPIEVGKSPGPDGVGVQVVDASPVKQEAS